MPLRFPWKTVAAGGVILGGLGALALAIRRPTSPTPPKRVALIGDSYAVGLGPELEKLLSPGWYRQGSAATTSFFRYEGYKNTNTSQWAHHTAACGSCGDWLTTFKPDVVLVSLGVNDGAAPNPANYQTIVRALHGIGARVVWIEPPAGVDTPAVRAVIASLGVQTIPATTTPMASDGIHPISYRRWAEEIAAAVTHA